MDAKLRMQMILLSEKMKQNKEIADKLVERCKVFFADGK